MDQEQIYSWYETYKNGIFRYILSITKDPYFSEDILQDLFVKLLSGGLRCAPGKEQAWLYRVARNLCYDQLRRLKREQACLQTPRDQNMQYEYIDLISSLSLKEQEIVTLKIVGGLTHQEIGTVLGMTAKAAQKRYERAIHVLRDKEDSYGTKTT